jgi:hypothetical protein
MIFALLFGGVLMVGRAGFAGFKTPTVLTPRPLVTKHDYACNTTQRFAPADAIPSTIFISTFDTVADAQNQFSDATNASQGVVTLFGQTLFHGTTRPDVPTNKQTVVEYPASNYVASVVLTCRAETDAAALALANELEAYLEPAPYFLVVPSWIPQPHVTDEQDAAQQRARRTFREIQRTKALVYNHPEYQKLTRQVLSTYRQKRKTEHRTLVKKMPELARELTQQELINLKDRHDDFDATLIDLYLHEPDPTAEAVHAEWQTKVAERIGEAPQTDGLPASADGWFAMRYGQVKRDGATLRFEYLTFRRTDLGLPAFADFLCSRGCSNIRYTILGSGPEDY